MFSRIFSLIAYAVSGTLVVLFVVLSKSNYVWLLDPTGNGGHHFSSSAVLLSLFGPFVVILVLLLGGILKTIQNYLQYKVKKIHWAVKVALILNALFFLLFELFSFMLGMT